MANPSENPSDGNLSNSNAPSKNPANNNRVDNFNIQNSTRNNNPNKLSEEEKDQLRTVVNARISQVCNYAALIIALIALASFILGQFDTFFIQVGTLVAIALLAIAAINNPARK